MDDVGRTAVAWPVDGEDEGGYREGPIRLSALEFTDLFVNADGHARIRGAGDRRQPLTDVPPEVVDDIEELRRRALIESNGRDEFPLDYDEVRYRVSVIEAQAGDGMTFRRLLTAIPRLGNLGLRPMAARSLGIIGSGKGSGLILVSGPTGAGKTTTVGSILQEYLIRFGDVAITIEDPPELPLEGRYAFGECYQFRVEDGDFAKPMRRALRSQPRYILVGEIRDPESASTLLRAAQSGHVCLATIHASTIQQSLTSLLKYVASTLNLELAHEMLASSVAAVINQRLSTTTIEGRVTRRPVAETLFFRGDERGLPAMIRGGNIDGLKNEIDRQRILIDKNQDPFPKTAA